MEPSHENPIRITAAILLATVATQIAYTGLYLADVSPSRQVFWGVEALLFTMLAAFAGAMLARTSTQHLGWSAITISAVFNLVQVSIGATMFVPFRQVAGQVDGLGTAAGAVVALSFMIYYAAKLLLGLAAVAFGLARIMAGARTLGTVSVAVGAVAILSNGILIVFGRDGFLPSPIAGGSGVVATLVLGFLLWAEREPPMARS
ncbi:MAG: thiamine biosynthesis protein ThiC [Pseudomonadota bacterium]